jgi:hypothetical protein
MAVLLALFALAPAAQAAFHFDLSGGTNFPVDIGGRATLELPGRFLISGSAGYIPDRYVGLINDTLVRFNAYPPRTAELIESSVDRGLVGRAQLGWRPLPWSGLYFLAGYTLVQLEGSITTADLSAFVLGERLPELETSPEGQVRLGARSRLHQVSAEIGWQWVLLDRITIAAALGGFGTLDADTRLALEGATPLGIIARPFLVAGESYLNDKFTSYAHGGTVSLRLGYRFF